LGYSGTVDCYDVGMVGFDKEFSKDSLTVRLTLHYGFYNGDGAEYDVVCDDCFLHGMPGSRQWKSKYWSQKDFAPVRPFFHIREGRKFSHSLHPEWLGNCPCERCIFEAYLPYTAKGWLSFVEPSRCQRGDANAKSDIWKQYSHFSSVQTFTKVQERASFAVSSTLPDINIVEKERASEGSVMYIGIDPSSVGITGGVSQGWNVITNKVFSSVVTGCVGEKYFFPPELITRGFVGTGHEKANLKEMILAVTDPSGPKIYNGFVKEVTDPYGRTAKVPAIIPNSELISMMYCHAECKLVPAPHNCSPIAHLPISPLGHRVFHDGWLLNGFLDSMSGEYCPRCNMVENPHTCLVIPVPTAKCQAELSSSVLERNSTLKKN